MKKGLCLTMCSGILWVGSLAVAQTPERETTTTTKTATVREEPERLPDFTIGSREAAAALLRERVPSVDWTETTFEEVLDWLRDQGEGRVNVVAKMGPLGIEGVKDETSVTLKLNNTTVADVLNEVLDQLSEDGQIQYRGIGNKLTISTKRDFEKKMYVRVYDVADLLFRVPNFGEGAPLINLQQAGRSSGGGGAGGGGQSVFQGSSSGQERGQSTQQEEQENEMRLQKIRELIEQTIAHETWDSTGGSTTSLHATGGGGGGRIRVHNTSLIVLNTIEVHEMIAGAFVFGE